MPGSMGLPCVPSPAIRAGMIDITSKNRSRESRASQTAAAAVSNPMTPRGASANGTFFSSGACGA